MEIKYIPIERNKHIKYRIKWLSDPEITKQLGTAVRNGADLNFHKKWFNSYEKEEKKKTKKIFMIEADGKIIGQVGLLDINQDDKNAILYIVIGEKDYWGQGFGKEAMKFIHNFAFNDLKLHKINLYVHTNNIRAIGLYQKFGYREVGVLRENLKHGDKYEDETIMEFIK